MKCLLLFSFLVARAYFAGEGMSTFIGLAPSDILYGPLPLYHTAGGILGLGHSLFTGGATVLKRKFSVSQFWSDCVKYRCTVRFFFLVNEFSGSFG